MSSTDNLPKVCVTWPKVNCKDSVCDCCGCRCFGSDCIVGADGATGEPPAAAAAGAAAGASATGNGCGNVYLSGLFMISLNVGDLWLWHAESVNASILFAACCGLAQLVQTDFVFTSRARINASAIVGARFFSPVTILFVDSTACVHSCNIRPKHFA